MGFSNRGSAHRAVFNGLSEREAEEVNSLRGLELARLDAPQAVIWQSAMDGGVKARGAESVNVPHV